MTASNQRTSFGRWFPYVLVGLTLPVGLLVLLLEPLPWAPLNTSIGAILLLTTLASVAHLVARHAGPGERGPDF